MALSSSPENSRNDVPPAAPFKHMVHESIRGFKLVASEGVPGMRPASQQPHVSQAQESQGENPEVSVPNSVSPAIVNPADEVRAKLGRALRR
ncbi:MAG: hypothetical protein NTX63_04320 [Candidatus Peregrinibacteria bacterium]|nr:hypothetical protein [Candidatus Peregrinibacteria bacterium]